MQEQHLDQTRPGFTAALTTGYVLLSIAICFAATIRPMPLVSSGKQSFVSTGVASALFDGDLTTNWSGANSSWIAVKVGNGYSKLLLNWVPTETASWIPYWDQAGSTGSLGDYQIRVSANSTDGQDGVWTTVVTVTGSHFVGRMHSFDFTGMQWIKLVITAPAAYSGDPISLAELQIFDASNGTDNTWFFMGNSITSTAFHNSITPSFAQNIATAHPGYNPAKICGGQSGIKSSDGVSAIDGRLAVNPDVRYWCLEFGTNDNAGGQGNDTAQFRANMEIIISKIIGAGHVPILSRVPFNFVMGDQISYYNVVIDDLTRKHQLTPGPDLYTWFQTRRSELSDGTHPNNVGSASMNRLWAQAVSSLFDGTVSGGDPTQPINRTIERILKASSVGSGELSITTRKSGMVSIYNLDGTRVMTFLAQSCIAHRMHLGSGTYLVQFSSDRTSELDNVIVK